MQRYELLVGTYGNEAIYIRRWSIYSVVEPGDYEDYEIPPEALTDQKFANMIREGEKYLDILMYGWIKSKHQKLIVPDL